MNLQYAASCPLCGVPLTFEEANRPACFQCKQPWMKQKPQITQREIWDKAVAEAKKEAGYDREAIRRALKESRLRHTTKVRHLP